MLINKNNIKVPDYLDEGFFLKILQTQMDSFKINIKTISFSMGSSSGENYCSDIYRVAVIFSLVEKDWNRISLIVKSMPTFGEKAVLDDFAVYEKETKMYFKVIPKIEKILKHTKIASRCYYAIQRPIQTIVFEDLKTYGFVTGKRQEGFDEIHSKMVLDKLGKFHAASMVLAKKDLKLMNSFDFGLFSPKTVKGNLFKTVFPATLKQLIPIVQKWSGYEKIAKKLEHIHVDFAERVLQQVASRQGELKVLNHDDLWINNIMFTYDNHNSNVPKDVIFVDYQMCFYSSPGIDINYFLNTSVALDVLKTKREQLISTYYYSLADTLEQLGYDNLPTVKDIQTEIRAKEFYGFVTAIGMLPIILLDRKQSEGSNLDTLSDGDAAQKAKEIVFTSKKFIDIMQYTLKRLDDLKIFD